MKRMHGLGLAAVVVAAGVAMRSGLAQPAAAPAEPMLANCLVSLVEEAKVPAREAGDAAVFKLTPVQIACADDGRTTWKRSEKETGRWMLAVTDVASYPSAMTRAVAELFKTLG